VSQTVKFVCKGLSGFQAISRPWRRQAKPERHVGAVNVDQMNRRATNDFAIADLGPRRYPCSTAYFRRRLRDGDDL
jgi:hypothetical protein